MQHKPIIFLGSNSNLQLYHEIAIRAGLTVAGIIDSDYFGNVDCLYGLPILASENVFDDVNLLKKYQSEYCFFVATNWSSDPSNKRDFLKRLNLISIVEKYNLQLTNIIDPSAYVSNTTILKNGIFVGPHCYIEANVLIENYAQIHYGVGIGHHSRIGSNTVVQRQAGVVANIGNNCYIGMWTKLYKPGMLTVGDNAIINPSLYVARDVLENEHVKLSKDNKRIFQYPALST
jgi:carbonic anhydrase/acetyltransferase-like protein (isoleucine patch superfamily)